MAQNSEQTDLSFLEESKGPKLHIKDILFTILRNLHWLILCGAIGATIAFFYVHRQNRIYESSAKIVLRGNTNNGDNTLREASVKGMFTNKPLYNSTINNEVMILTSKTTMLRVVENLELNVTYTATTRLVKRKKDLYGESPIKVNFIDNNDNDYVAIKVTPIDDKQIRIQYGEYKPIVAPLNDTVATAAGRIVINRTWFYTPDFYNIPIDVVHANTIDVAEYYRHAMSVVRDDDYNTIVNLTLRDLSPLRAADIINEVIKVYNDDAVNDKKRIIAFTYDYINERLSLLHADLGDQETALATFKRDNQLLDIDNYGQSFMATNIESSQEVDRLKKQLSLARYLLQVNETNNTNALIPPSIGIEDNNVMAVIGRFNDIVLKLDKYENKSNPVVKNLVEEQNTLKVNLSRLLDVYIGVLQERIADAQAIASRASGKMRQVPEKQLYIENVERLQKIKEELYLNLLSKREELLISQPSIEGNAKVIDEARVNRVPISPNETKSTLIGLLIGLLVPIAIFFLRKILDTQVHYYSDIQPI